MFPRTSNAARPSILHRALRTAVAFATLEAVVLEPGESAATRGAGPSGAAPGSSSPFAGLAHPHRAAMRPRRTVRRPGTVARPVQPCLAAPVCAVPPRRVGAPCARQEAR